MDPREFQLEYARAHRNGVGQHTAHIISAEMLRHHNMFDMPDNYRMKSAAGNLLTDRYIERGMIRGGGFEPGWAGSPQGKYGERYVSNQDCVDRCERMIGMFDASTPKMLMRDTYRAARDAGMDLRAFNGLDFKRPK